MTQYPNIVWLLVDSIRAYRTDQDLRGKLPVMERFGESSVEFTTCVTTAPSTIMSITAMMTGLPAYFLARNYDDFRFDNRHYHSLAGVLARHGYTSYAFLRGPETREKFSTLIATVPRRYWPPQLKHGVKWANRDLNLVLERLLQTEVPRPAFFFFHYNPQTGQLVDPEVSGRVENAWQQLLAAGFTPDNTIYVLCSDHGFPDPSTGMTTEWEIKHRLTHDLVLTDDNILIPLYIQYPGCTPRRITTPVSSLDIFPTLLDLVGIPDRERIRNEVDGRSLVRLMETGDATGYESRYFRSDSRLMLQTGRSTAIRNEEFKYIRYHDEFRLPTAAASPSALEVFIDLRHDPMEEKNLLLLDPLPCEVEEKLALFRAEFERSERRAIQFQINHLLARQRKIGLEKNGAEGRKLETLLVFEPETAAYAQIGVGAIARAYPNAQVDVLTSSDTLPEDVAGLARRVYRYSYGVDGRIATPELSRNGNRPVYDLAFLFVQNPSAPIVAQLLDVAKTIKARRQLVLDCNFNVYRRRRYWYYRARAVAQRLSYIVDEPSLLLEQVKVGRKFMARHLLRTFGLWERWSEARPQERYDDE